MSVEQDLRDAEIMVDMVTAIKNVVDNHHLVDGEVVAILKDIVEGIEDV